MTLDKYATDGSNKLVVFNSNNLETLLFDANKAIDAAREAVEKLAVERGNLKLSSSRIIAVAKELKQLGKVLAECGCQY